MQDGQKMRHESESNNNQESKDKKGDLPAKEESVECKAEPLEANCSGSGEVTFIRCSPILILNNTSSDRYFEQRRTDSNLPVKKHNVFKRKKKKKVMAKIKIILSLRVNFVNVIFRSQALQRLANGTKLLTLLRRNLWIKKRLKFLLRKNCLPYRRQGVLFLKAVLHNWPRTVRIVWKTPRIRKREKTRKMLTTNLFEI